jgi:hypothetical protein
LVFEVINEMKKKSKEKLLDKAKIDEKDGLSISYDKTSFEEFLPHLISEMNMDEKRVKIDKIVHNVEVNEPEKSDQINRKSEEPSNPGAIDFIRRCTSEEDAIEILDYLIKRNEITLIEYNNYKNKISEKGGLQKLINESGGPKKPGYYIDKYYKKCFNAKKTQNK